MYPIVVFIESRAFTRRLRDLAGILADEVLRSIQNDLLRDPYRGTLVRGLGGIRKARAANPRRGKGKRGGYRHLYLYLERHSHLHLLILLDKDEQEDLTAAQRTMLRGLVAEIAREEA